MRPPVVLGVDGGGAKTIALAADAGGRIIGAARCGNTNAVREDLQVAMAAVAGTCREALAQAGQAAAALGMFCLSGADWPEDHEPRAALLRRAGIAERVVVKNDAFAGLRAGTAAPYGIVIAAGSGSNTAVITPDGREWAFGYYVTGGGGGDCARSVFEAVLRQDDGRGPPTALTPLALAQLGYDTPEQMLRERVSGRLSHARMRALCPLLFEAADAGDEVARAIVVEQGQVLAEYATALIRRYDMGSLAFDVVLAGSVFKARGPLLVDTITEAVRRAAPRARIVRARFEPAVGALLLAYDALGMPVTDSMYANLARTTPGAALFDTARSGDDREGSA